MKKCNYRNCDTEILSDNADKTYCNSKCKSNEAKYRHRRRLNPDPVIGRPRGKYVRWSDIPYLG